MFLLKLLGDTKEINDGVGTGSMSVNILNPDDILNDAQYNVIFKSTDDYPLYKTLSYNVVRTFEGASDTIIVNEDTTTIGEGRVSQPFDGMAVTILNDTTVSVVDSLTGWLSGKQ
jgi:hypothetical protein